MTKKTNVLLKVFEIGPEEREILPYCRVKIDAQGFPYIIVLWQKFLITRVEFPQELRVYGDLYGRVVDCIEGIGELKHILANPDLTVDRLSLQQLNRITR